MCTMLNNHLTITSPNNCKTSKEITKPLATNLSKFDASVNVSSPHKANTTKIGIFTFSNIDFTIPSTCFSPPISYIRKSTSSELEAFKATFAVCTFLDTKVLGALLVDDDGMWKDGACAALGQSHGFMSPHAKFVMLLSAL